MIRIRRSENDRTISRELSVDALSATIISKSSKSCSKTLRIVLPMYSAWLKQGMQMEKKGIELILPLLLPTLRRQVLHAAIRNEGVLRCLQAVRKLQFALQHDVQCYNARQHAPSLICSSCPSTRDPQSATWRHLQRPTGPVALQEILFRHRQPFQRYLR